MLEDRWARLVDALHRKSLEGDLAWEEAESSTYLAEILNYKVSISSDKANGAAPTFKVVVMGSNKNELDNFSNEDLQFHFRGGTYSRKMSEIHTLAQRQANGVDKAIDEIIDYFEGD